MGAGSETSSRCGGCGVGEGEGETVGEVAANGVGLAEGCGPALDAQLASNTSAANPAPRLVRLITVSG